MFYNTRCRVAAGTAVFLSGILLCRKTRREFRVSYNALLENRFRTLSVGGASERRENSKIIKCFEKKTIDGIKYGTVVHTLGIIIL